MNAFSEDIKDMLEDPSSLGLTFGTNLFVGGEPAKPDATVTIFDTPSFPPLKTLAEVPSYFKSSCQVRIRDKDYLTAERLARSIMESLHSRAGQTWNDTIYMDIQATGEPSFLDRDANHRPRFIINFNCQRR